MKFFFVFALVFSLIGCSPDKSDNGASTVDTNAPLPDFSTYSDVKEKKAAFFDFLLPLVHEANLRIMSERQLIEKWQDGKKLSASEQKKLNKIFTKYRVTTDDTKQQEEILLRRIYPIPPSIVLAQAANESGWGNSRFAREGNNLFGQWCFTIGCGIVPGERNHRAKHEVKVFDTPFDSVSSYMRNLNSHEQYKDLRGIREQLLQQDELVDGLQLADGLLKYSERREEYVIEIKQMIISNKLQELDTEPLGETVQ